MPSLASFDDDIHRSKEQDTRNVSDLGSVVDCARISSCGGRRMAGYGAVTEGSRRGVVVAATIGSIILFSIFGVFIWKQIAKQRANDEADLPSFAAEHDALKNVASTLEAVAAIANAQTKPDAFRKPLDAARAAIDAEAVRQNFSTPLPSGRPWPGQFAAARKDARTALDFYEGLAVHMERRAETARKTKDERDFVLVETDIRNVARTAGESLESLKSAIGEMQSQRDAKSWTYGPASRKTS